MRRGGLRTPGVYVSLGDVEWLPEAQNHATPEALLIAAEEEALRTSTRPACTCLACSPGKPQCPIVAIRERQSEAGKRGAAARWSLPEKAPSKHRDAASTMNRLQALAREPRPLPTFLARIPAREAAALRLHDAVGGGPRRGLRTIATLLGLRGPEEASALVAQARARLAALDRDGAPRTAERLAEDEANTTLASTVGPLEGQSPFMTRDRIVGRQERGES